MVERAADSRVQIEQKTINRHDAQRGAAVQQSGAKVHRTSLNDPWRHDDGKASD